MRKTANICSVLSFLPVLFVGCQQASVGVEEHQPVGDTTVVDSRGFDPLDLPGDRTVLPLERPNRSDLVAPERGPRTGDEPKDSLAVPLLIRPAAIDSNTHQAFRVQLFTTRLFGEAKQAVRVAEEVFDQPVFVDYEVPYFKVRVGSFAGRDDAERYLQKAHTAGYTNAWVVVVNLDVREPELLYDKLPPTVPPSDTLTDSSIAMPHEH